MEPIKEDATGKETLVCKDKIENFVEHDSEPIWGPFVVSFEVCLLTCY